MKIKSIVGKAGFFIKKNSSEILLGAGLIGGVTAAVLACKATPKVVELKKVCYEGFVKVDDALEDESVDYSKEDALKDQVIFTTQFYVGAVKTYAPALILGTLSIGCILESHKILRKRLIALGTAYALLDTGFKQYRSRVADKYGVDTEKEIRYGMTSTTVEEIVTNDNGKEKTVTKEIKSVNPNNYSPYSRFFDESNPNWEKESEFNFMFLNSAQQHANDLLQVRGHLFLNEVYDMIGIPRSKAGQVVGWIYDQNGNVNGDNYVDFGMFNTARSKVVDFVNGYENVILLDFNVDGDILDRELIEVI